MPDRIRLTALANRAPWRTAPPPAGVVEMLLKDRSVGPLAPRRKRATHPDPAAPGRGLAGFAIYGVVATIVLNAFWSTYHVWWNWVPAARWREFNAGNLVLAYTIGLIAANGICLPSFYFYGLLAGVRTTMLSVAAQP